MKLEQPRYIMDGDGYRWKLENGTYRLANFDSTEVHSLAELSEKYGPLTIPSFSGPDDFETGDVIPDGHVYISTDGLKEDDIQRWQSIAPSSNHTFSQKTAIRVAQAIADQRAAQADDEPEPEGEDEAPELPTRVYAVTVDVDKLVDKVLAQFGHYHPFDPEMVLDCDGDKWVKQDDGLYYSDASRHSFPLSEIAKWYGPLTHMCGCEL